MAFNASGCPEPFRRFSATFFITALCSAMFCSAAAVIAGVHVQLGGKPLARIEARIEVEELEAVDDRRPVVPAAALLRRELREDRVDVDVLQLGLAGALLAGGLRALLLLAAVRGVRRAGVMAKLVQDIAEKSHGFSFVGRDWVMHQVERITPPTGSTRWTHRGSSLEARRRHDFAMFWTHESHAGRLRSGIVTSSETVLKQPLLFRAFAIAGVAALILIPIGLISGKISERQARAGQVVRQFASETSGRSWSPGRSSR
jgi:hypothetical protein